MHEPAAKRQRLEQDTVRSAMALQPRLEPLPHLRSPFLQAVFVGNLPWMNAIMEPVPSVDWRLCPPGPSSSTASSSEPRALPRLPRAKLVGAWDWPAALESKRQKALDKWLTLLELCDHGSAVGDQMHAVMEAGRKAEEARDVLVFAASPKSTATLEKRARDLCKVVTWMQSNFKKIVLPPSAEDVVEYLQEALASGGSSSRGHTCVEALNFLAHTFGVRGAAEVAEDPVVRGAAHQLRLRKRSLVQAPPLKVDRARVLEDVAATSEDQYEAAIAGHVCFLLYACARWSDGQRVVRLYLDENEHGGGYLEADSAGTKTSKTAEDKRKMLPLVAPLNGVSGAAWGRAWLARRRELGLVRRSWHSSPTSPRRHRRMDVEADECRRGHFGAQVHSHVQRCASGGHGGVLHPLAPHHMP